MQFSHYYYAEQKSNYRFIFLYLLSILWMKISTPLNSVN